MKTDEEGPNCKACWDKGFSSVYSAGVIAFADFVELGEKDAWVKGASIEIKYCKCKAGKNAKRRHKRNKPKIL